ncbi:MAG TPA: bifunctional pyr operon transcriptional regulator/uracil phosphoribosyltransferase PyrR, partial [Methylophilus sp.]
MNTPLPDPEALLDNLYAQILPRITAETAMVGIYTGGVWLLERLLPRLTAAVGHDIPTGKLDAAMYRD